MSDAVAERTALPTVYEWQAKSIEDAANLLAFWVSTTPEDKLTWQPACEGFESKGRTIYDQIHECAQVNRRFALILKGEKPGPWIEEPTYASTAGAEEDIKASAAELAAAVRALDDSAFAREYTTGMGPMTGAGVMSLALNNMHYHGGQINQIQLLLGDGEFRYPGH